MKITLEHSKNLYTYMLLLLLAGIGILYGKSITPLEGNIRLWDLTNILILGIGIPFIFLQDKASLPNFWQRGIPQRNRFIIPFCVGLFFGLLDVIVFKVILHPEPYQQLPPFLQPFPYSIFLYVSGAFEVEVFYRLIPLTLFMLLGAHYKKGRYMTAFFWTAAILTSLREPIEQLGDHSLLITIYSLLTGFVMNLLQAIYFRKSGFLASLTLRLGHYFFWHILLGVYVEYLEIS